MIQEIWDRILEWKRYQTLDQLDWVTRNTLIVKKQLAELNAKAKKLPPPKNKRKFLFWSLTAWERGSLEHMIGLCLRLRGHEVHGVTCGGNMSACSMESMIYPKPYCQDCKRRAKSFIDMFDMQGHFSESSKFLDPQRQKEIEEELQKLSIDEILKHTHHGVETGRICDRDLPQYYFKLCDIHNPEIEARVRDTFLATVLYTEAAKNAIDEIQPDIIIATSGKTIGLAPMYELALKQKIPVITWDEVMGGKCSFLFTFNNFANEYHLDEQWGQIRQEPLTEEEQDFISYYFKHTRKGDFGRVRYYNAPIEDQQKIRDELNLDDRPIVLLIGNLTWDTSTLGKDRIFKSMLHWMYETIDHLKERQDIQLVIRCHPAEGHAPAYMVSAELVSDAIANRYGELPENIHVVKGEDEINSHTLADLSNMICVYTSTMGIEMSMNGRVVTVCGQAHYRGRGFTVDVEDKSDYFAKLDSVHETETRLDETRVNLAKKYAYMVIRRVPCHIPEFNYTSRHNFDVFPERFLADEENYWDKICQNFVEEGLFLDTTEFCDPWKTGGD